MLNFFKRLQDEINNQLEHYIYDPEDDSINNEFNTNNIILDNFIKIFKYLNNKFSYHDNYLIGFNKNIYIPSFFRFKNNGLYYFSNLDLEFRNTNIIKRIAKKYNMTIHKITYKKYIRIIQFFNKKIIFQYKQNIILQNIKINKQTNIQELKNITLENKNILYILQYMNIQCLYESSYIYINNIVLKTHIYIPSEDKYYFILPALTTNELLKIQLLKKNDNIYKIDYITKNMYDNIIKIFYDKIPQLNILDIKLKNTTNSTNSNLELKCAICNKKIDICKRHGQSYIPKYCSAQCASLAQTTYIYQKCINCNNEFLIPKKDMKKIYFCSSKCVNQYKNNNMIKKIGKSIFREDICYICHKRFFYFSNKKNKYCSSKCANLAHRKTRKNKK